MNAFAETRIRCFATRKGADFRFLFHLFSRYRVSLVIPGTRPRAFNRAIDLRVLITLRGRFSFPTSVL
ncbi:hypothetical protein NDU88_003095 [Pleurodeles waltl]|uniref:Uncharacterized protein n=1 Tax=Pleurodeles waltl TaxID=8319 RepID=A0AAV7SDJ3_PLEWA|nr:hypothetical protein NDU88_003095 [Pleurodeles waltl]